MKNRRAGIILGYAIMAISLVIALVFSCNTELLGTPGYSLSVDGIVISRNLYILFFLSGFLFLGSCFIKKK